MEIFEAQSTANAPDGTRLRWLFVLVLSPVLICGCFTTPFLNYDDTVGIEQSRLMKADTPLKEAVLPDPADTFYYPLTILSWRADRAVWGNLLAPIAGKNAWPAGIRLTNLLLHCIGAALVFFIMRKLGLNDRLSGFVLIVFTLHPLAVESVAWTIERKNLLAGSLGLLTIFLHMRAVKVVDFAAAALAFVGALLSKPSALGVLPVLVLYDLLLRPNGSISPSLYERLKTLPWLATVVRLIPAVLIALGFSVLTLRLQHTNIMKPPGGTAFTGLLTDSEILARYIGSLLWPGYLSAYYFVEPIGSLAETRFWIYFALLATIGGASVFACKPERRLLACFGWLWFVGALGPNLNLVGINDLMHDRFIYISTPGFLIVVALAIEGLFTKLSPSLLKSMDSFVRPAFAGLITALVFVSAGRSLLWSNEYALFSDAYAKQPNSSYATLFLAREIKNRTLEAPVRPPREQWNAALLQYQQLLDHGFSAPDFDRYQYKAEAFIDRAYLAYLAEKDEEAQLWLVEALEGEGKSSAHALERARAFHIYGKLALVKNNQLVALQNFDMALRLNPLRYDTRVLAAQTFVDLAEKQRLANDAASAADSLRRARLLVTSVPASSPSGKEAAELLKKLDAKLQNEGRQQP